MIKSINGYDWSSILSDVLCRIDKPADMSKFLRDIMTEKEIAEISARLQAAVMLNANERYTDISNQTGLSSRTVARISSWLKQDNGGYSKAIKLVNKHHVHM